MLLRADPDRLDLAAALADFLETLGDGLLRGFDPDIADPVRHGPGAGPRSCRSFLREGDDFARLDIEHRVLACFWCRYRFREKA